MKRIYLLPVFICISIVTNAQIIVNDTMGLFLDSLLMELPEIMVKGERPVVKAEEGKLVYDLPRLVNDLPVNNAMDAIKELPGIVDIGSGLTLAGQNINIVINGKVSSLTPEQLNELLRSIPVSHIEKAEVMYAAPARYQVRGPMVNLVLKKGTGENKLTGEVSSAWQQKYYEDLTERASLLYSSPKFSADLLYSYNFGRSRQGGDKEALHTVGDKVYEMNLTESRKYKFKRHNVRMGMDYNITADNLLSLVYTTRFNSNNNKGISRGTEHSNSTSNGDDQLHNVQLGYRASFGLNAGVEFTFYKSPGDQLINSVLNEEEINVRYKDQQRINRWKFYAMQEHQLANGWGLNYGANYTTSVDNSFQNYYDVESGQFVPEKSMTARREEYTINGFAGFSKSFGEKLSVDASFAAELYHSDIWNEWMYYPTLNVNYLPAPGHIFQLSFTSDKSYPEFWSMNNTISYMGAYSEIQGNPLLKPSVEYGTSLSYILKSKYIFTAFFNHEKDYFTQLLYQDPNRLAEIYKFMNEDYMQQIGIQAVIPFKVQSWLNSRITLTGINKREKDSDFWDIPFNRNHTTFVVGMNNTFTLSTKPDIRLNVSAFYQNGTIQGIYNITRSGNLDASLQWRSTNQRARVIVKGMDLLNTSQVSTKINFKGQNVSNKYWQTNRGVEVSFSYSFGDYKEKKRNDVDTSRFK